MQTIINFLIRNKVFLFYILLLFIAMVFTVQSHSYHKSKFINSANFLSGGLYNSVNNFSNYLNLKEQNTLLQEENNYLKSIVFNKSRAQDSIYLDTTLTKQSKYNFIPARIIRNSYNLNNNVLLIDKGKNDSLKQDNGVISSKGILGIIDNTSSKYATVISILNSASRISCQLKSTNHFGSLSWNGKNHNIVQLTEIPKQALVKPGDTIITSGRSSIFPKGIPVGIVKDFTPDKTDNFINLNIVLFNDMTNLEHVYVIKNKDIDAINTLLNKDYE